ncbi:fused response regulator/phosphatase [Marinibactrum halimedae]|uniref:Fused response regulator/phosphatase n=1 Tax=Marinibactrum halimedae TaxID=1444977 RepID=A0AA37T5K3_9GAMM|nr:fused response regulator/phosphatase [Marinibactrum halimedae]MCD9458846.1 fused response regulator/phosphatase [Marinibactrum halimedae]GLS27698.1 fused response regulator/phosphatase [Marinibactrum halimedae]
MLTVLVADDTSTDRMILESLVRQLGYITVPASNGLEAIAFYQQYQPDIVLMDVLMPEMDGLEAARSIKKLAGENFVPILFLTSLSDTESLVACLDAGGDDFIPKPYNKPILQAKINAFGRMRELQTTLLQQRDQIRLNNNTLLQEQAVAKKVFDNVAGKGCLDDPNIRFHLSSQAIFNGDVLVAAHRPNGNLMLLLGDFTGHGLPAAIGSMPLATAFYGMVSKGFSLQDILREINHKLKTLLPPGIFCCASLLEVDYQVQQVKVWNGGLPSGVLYRGVSGEVELLSSQSLPLGIMGNDRLNSQCRYFDISATDRIYLWTDGIHEARSFDGEMFGEARLLEVFRHGSDVKANQIFDRILEAVHEHVGSDVFDDDLSLVEISLASPPEPTDDQDVGARGDQGLIEWSMSFEIKPPTFLHFDPLPLLMTVISDVPGLRGKSAQVYTVLAELYSNALEHGLLQLDSSLKNDAEGFAEYYRLRKRRLEQLTEGFIRFTLAHSVNGDEGVLRLTLEDSGEGFDHHNKLRETGEKDFSGRGIALVTTLCASLTYEGNGNIVKAVFTWKD